MRRARWLRAASFAAPLATVTLMMLVAGAHHTDLVDPNDTRGKLDVSQVRLAHVGGPPSWKVVTFRKWGIREIWDRGYIMVLLDTRSGERAEYYLLIRSNGSSLKGSLWSARAFGPDSHLGGVPVRKVSRRSASVQVRLGRLTFGEKRLFYRWWVHTVFTSDRCRRTCHDRAPNSGAVLQWRPGMSPTPSPSPAGSTGP
jgi:hypothetical protein